MQKNIQLVLCAIFLILIAISAQAHETSLLFIGNSYTYYPQTPQNPGLPKYFKKIAESIDPSLKLNISFFVHGNYTYEMQFNDPASKAKMKMAYDHVIVQGRSIEALEQTPYNTKHEQVSLQSFSTYFPKVLKLVLEHNRDVTVYVNWVWNAKHAMLQEGHPGLHFPVGHPRTGQKWISDDPHKTQEWIDQSYRDHAAGLPVHFAWVGDAWLKLQDQEFVSADELYAVGDWSHPSPLGSFVTALVLVREVLHLDIRKNTFIPEGVNAVTAKTIQRKL